MSAGQLRLLLARERLTEERAAALSPVERRGLEALRQALALGAELGLARTSSYRHLVEGERGEGVHVVIAAPADRVEPRTWWFPVVGRVPYRGYFDRASAQVFASELAAEGDDTYVRPALLYSTLGYFDDPVPRALLGSERREIVNTIVHELVHETVFVPDDAAYNESLATFVAHRATLRFFANDPDASDAEQRAFADALRFGELLEALTRDLEALYLRTSGADDARRERERVFAHYQQEVFPAVHFETESYAGFPRIALSNAWLVAHRTYVGDLPCLERELDALAGDLAALVRAHRDRPGRRGDCPALGGPP